MIDGLSKDEWQYVLKHPSILTKYYFKDDFNNPLILTPRQEEIVRHILLKYPKRMMIWATTRWGKSLAIAIGSLILAITMPGEKIRIIAPTGDLSRVIMDYIINHIADHEDIIKSVILDKGENLKNLKRQISKQRITFKNSSEISIHSAGIGSEGRSLLGRGGTLIIVDEAESIPEEIIRTRIMRMAGETPDSMVVMISNPVYRGYMYMNRHNPEWHKIKVDWKTAVAEGRLTEEFVMERKREMTEQEFRIWYEAEYPEDTDTTLIKWRWIEEARDKPAPSDEIEYECIGVDVAGMGEDLTVVVHVKRYGDFFKVENILSWAKLELMQSAEKVIEYMEEKGIKNAIIDETGIGGMASILKEHNHEWNIKGINFGAGATLKNCYNMKSELYYNLMSIFKDGKISIPHHPTLEQQLNAMQVEITTQGKIRVLDGQSKSPDFADALALACYHKLQPEVVLGKTTAWL